ncbi:hypothetical protein BTUL_0181g00270 [Botrytis tulipae]|uniref:NADAR domain-containing protein n=1 Tax=Botrytis tulipae TaxID=87230 RepID=A0A4Z1EA69_9HELO|nr:hypothetical protein BTUL_0181g00270 [Botrytis tulipae]
MTSSDAEMTEFNQIAVQTCGAFWLGDSKACVKIENAKTASDAKKIGESLEIPDDEEWENVMQRVMMTVLLAKFSPASNLRNELLSTGDRLLVYSGEKDLVWASGLTTKQNKGAKVTAWPGKNWLGEILMQVRDALRNSDGLDLSLHIGTDFGRKDAAEGLHIVRRKPTTGMPNRNVSARKSPAGDTTQGLPLAGKAIMPSPSALIHPTQIEPFTPTAPRPHKRTKMSKESNSTPTPTKSSKNAKQPKKPSSPTNTARGPVLNDVQTSAVFAPYSQKSPRSYAVIPGEDDKEGTDEDVGDDDADDYCPNGSGGSCNGDGHNGFGSEENEEMTGTVQMNDDTRMGNMRFPNGRLVYRNSTPPLTSVKDKVVLKRKRSHFDEGDVSFEDVA